MSSVYTYKYKFNDRLRHLTKFDKIRLGKILEIFQYSFITFIIVLIITRIFNKYIFTETQEDVENYSTSQLILWTFIELFIIIIMFFYIRKIVLLFPSIPALYISGFTEHTVMDYVIHIALVYVVMELIPTVRFKIEALKQKVKYM